MSLTVIHGDWITGDRVLHWPTPVPMEGRLDWYIRKELAPAKRLPPTPYAETCHYTFWQLPQELAISRWPDQNCPFSEPPNFLPTFQIETFTPVGDDPRNEEAILRAMIHGWWDECPF